MKTLEDLKHVEELMRPGAITGDGFLGTDGRALADIIADDEKEMARLHIDFDRLRARMRALLDAGMSSMGKSTEVAQKWLVISDEVKGSFPCPWQDGLYHKEQVYVSLLNPSPEGPDRIAFNELSLHLIEKHHFFQGKGSPHRLEPAVLKAVLLV